MYVVDTNVLVEGKRRYYAFDLCPGFWTALSDNCRRGAVFSISPVRQEIHDGGEDDLTDWVDTNEEFFFDEDDLSLARLAEISEFVSSSPYKDAAKQRFLGGADPRLISYARAHELYVVTLERPAPDARRRVPIPDVCQAFGVSWISPFDMLRELAVRFELSA